MGGQGMQGLMGKGRGVRLIRIIRLYHRLFDMVNYRQFKGRGGK